MVKGLYAAYSGMINEQNRRCSYFAFSEKSSIHSCQIIDSLSIFSIHSFIKSSYFSMSSNLLILSKLTLVVIFNKFLLERYIYNITYNKRKKITKITNHGNNHYSFCGFLIKRFIYHYGERNYRTKFKICSKP